MHVCVRGWYLPMLRSHHFKRVYRSHVDDLPRDFYAIALRDSILYDRGSGYFSTAALLELAPGLVPFVRAGGTMRIITSVELSESSCALIEEGLRLQDEHVAADLERALDDAVNADEEQLDILDLIVNLIAADRLQIRVAYLPDGIYHEKFGLFFDAAGDAVYFSGSANETHAGLVSNREAITVLTSWEDGYETLNDEERYFSRIWDGRDEQLRVMSFPDACRQKLIAAYRMSSTVEQAVARIEERLSRPRGKQLYRYQREAIEQFVANGYRHFFQMATGTGKTFTAVKALEREIRDRGKTIAVVIVPQVDLQRQWDAELREASFAPVLCGGEGGDDPEVALDDAFVDYTLDASPVLICVNRTYFSRMAERVRSFASSANVFVIVDEAHALTAPQIGALPDAPARLGLSATPERFDEQESASIVTFFTGGDVEPYRYDIDRAIAAGFLTPYRYHPVYLELPEKEFEVYGQYARRLALLCSQEPPDEQAIELIRLARGRILKTTTAKIELLRQMIDGGRYDFVNAVVYCGAGKDRDTDTPIIREVTRLLNEAGLTAKSFFSGSDDRQGILREFEEGFFDTLVAIKCFDQGVDVRKLDKLYIMASDSSRRQTIQRRGRVLRICSETGKASADIFDMVLVPPCGAEDRSAARSLVTSEVARMREYASSALNKGDVDGAIEELCGTYGVEEVAFEDDDI